jgi:hypothetical protein
LKSCSSRATARAIGARHRPLRRPRPDLPRDLTDMVDACLVSRPNRRPTLEELGTAIEDSLDHLQDDAPEHRPRVMLRLSAVACAATAAGFLIAAHGGI